MLKKIFPLIAILACIALGGCASTATEGPGMIAHFSNIKSGQSVLIDSAVTSNGTAFANPGALSPTRNTGYGGNGKVMTTVPDRRGLPEWVQFTWTEHAYADKARTFEEYKTWPRETARVPVRDRVPASVISEIIQSRKDPSKNRKEDLSLWVYFLWTDTGIKLHWRQERGCCEVLRSGGDALSP